MKSERESWLTHPLTRSLRCVGCPCREPLRFERGDNRSVWRCPRCDRKYEHWEGMPVIVEAEALRPEETYSESHPKALKRLRRSSPGLFDLLKRVYRAYIRVEAVVTPNTPLEPSFHLKRMKQHLPGLANRIVLDVGGGSAPYRAVLDGLSDTWVVLEKDRYHARELRANGAQVDYLVGAGEAVPLLDSSCDLVVLTEVLEHCNRPSDVLAEIARVLRPGGYCVGTVPQYWHVHGWPSDYFRYTLHGLQFLASEAKLKVRSLEPKGGPLLLLWAVLDLTTSAWSRFPGISLLLRVPTLWIAWALDRLFYSDPRRMTYPDTAGWAFLFEKPPA